MIIIICVENKLNLKLKIEKYLNCNFSVSRQIRFDLTMLHIIILHAQHCHTLKSSKLVKTRLNYFRKIHAIIFANSNMHVFLNAGLNNFQLNPLKFNI